MVVGTGSGCFDRMVAQGKSVEQYKQLCKGSLLQNVMTVAVCVCNLVDIVQETVLLFSVQGNLVAEITGTAGEAGVQISLGGGEPFRVVGMNGQNDTLMYGLVYLGKLVALILVNDEKITRLDGIEFVVDQELPAAGNGIVDFITIMDMHVHGFFFFIQMRDGESPGGDTAFYGLLAGGEFFHLEGSF